MCKSPEKSFGSSVASAGSVLALYFIMFKRNEVMLKFVNNRILFKYAVCFSFIYYFECSVQSDKCCFSKKATEKC